MISVVSICTTVLVSDDHSSWAKDFDNEAKVGLVLENNYHVSNERFESTRFVCK